LEKAGAQDASNCRVGTRFASETTQTDSGELVMDEGGAFNSATGTALSDIALEDLRRVRTVVEKGKVPEEATRQIVVAGEINVGPLHRLSAFAPEVFDDSDASPDPIPSESGPAAPESEPPPPNRRQLRRAWDVGGMRRMRFIPTRKERDYRRRRMHDSTYLTFPAIALDLVETYRVTVLIQLDNKELSIVSGVDTCTSGNRINEDRIPPGFEMLPVIQPHFTAANDVPMVVHGMGMLPIRLGEGEDVIPMYLVRGLPLPMLSGTPFTNRYVRYIDCQAQLNLVQMLAGSRVALLEKTD
jgi:hypothetical protein